MWTAWESDALRLRCSYVFSHGLLQEPPAALGVASAASPWPYPHLSKIALDLVFPPQLSCLDLFDLLAMSHLGTISLTPLLLPVWGSRHRRAALCYGPCGHHMENERTGPVDPAASGSLPAVLLPSLHMSHLLPSPAPKVHLCRQFLLRWASLMPCVSLCHPLECSLCPSPFRGLHCPKPRPTTLNLGQKSAIYSYQKSFA